jgi:hypothetical protein
MTDAWDAIIRETLPSIERVTQPLASLLSPKEAEKLERQLRDPAKLPSIAAQFRQTVSTHRRAV